MSNSSTNQDTSQKVPTDRKAYLREYYRRNRQRALAYQRQYNIKFKKKLRAEEHPLNDNLPPTYNICDFMKANPNKLVGMIDSIINESSTLTLNI